MREDVLPALGVTVTDAAAQLGVTRAALSRVLNERAAISPEMALRLEGWLGVKNGGGAEGETLRDYSQPDPTRSANLARFFGHRRKADTHLTSAYFAGACIC